MTPSLVANTNTLQLDPFIDVPQPISLLKIMYGFFTISLSQWNMKKQLVAIATSIYTCTTYETITTIQHLSQREYREQYFLFFTRLPVKERFLLFSKATFQRVINCNPSYLRYPSDHTSEFVHIPAKSL